MEVKNLDKNCITILEWLLKKKDWRKTYSKEVLSKKNNKHKTKRKKIGTKRLRKMHKRRINFRKEKTKRSTLLSKSKKNKRNKGNNKMEKPWGDFCEIFGITPRNRVIEFLLCSIRTDQSIRNIAECVELNKATTYNIMEELIKKEYVVPTRKVGNTQLYILNTKKKEVLLLRKMHELILDKIADEVEEEYNQPKKVSMKY